MSQPGDSFGREWKPPSSATASPWLIGLLLGLVALLLVRNFSSSGKPASGPIQIPEPVARGDLDGNEQRTVNLFKANRDSVVYIQVTTYSVEARLGFQLHLEEVPRNLGTGFIWDQNGHIVTNFHVVAGSSSASVLLSDGTAWTAQLLGASPEHDIAVLKIEAPSDKLRPVTLGTSSDLEIGQSVFALGYPFGLNLTLTSGLISGLGQTIGLSQGAAIHDAIQVDASINPGNSGGPLLDSAGRLIGMNTAIITRGQATSGFGFAIPVDTIREQIKQIAANPIRRQPKLGIRPETQLATIVHQETGERRRLGVRIYAVIPGGPADKAGLRGYSFSREGDLLPGDVILAINGTPIDRLELFFELLSSYSPGDEISLTVLQGNNIRDFDVTLE